MNYGEAIEPFLQLPRNATGLALTDDPPIYFQDRSQFAHRPRREAFIRGIDFRQGQASFVASEPALPSQVNDHSPRNAWQAIVGSGSEQRSFAYQEKIGGVGFREEAFQIQHDGIVRAGGVGLDLGQNVVDEIVVMNLGIDALGRIASPRRRDETNAVPVVNGRFPFGQHDKATPVLIEADVHARSDLQAPRERQPDMHSVAHAVRLQRIEDCPLDVLYPGDVGEGHGFGRGDEPIQMGVQLKDTSIVDSQAFPDRVASLDSAVEH